MSNVGSPTKCSNQSSSLFSGNVLGNSLKIVEPYTKSRNFSERVVYHRITTERLTADKIRTILLKMNVKKPNVIDIGDYFLFAYENYPPIYIKKDDGLIYGKGIDYKEKVEAVRILRQLHSFDNNLVEGFDRIQKHSRNLTVPFLENHS
ncbi:hypothetical protein MUP77_00325 [Candidatus Bathyarchaeota archaeon]|nr:hypothetical protein [Candidatus Bathyarchaeota archaeon]